MVCGGIPPRHSEGQHEALQGGGKTHRYGMFKIILKLAVLADRLF